MLARGQANQCPTADLFSDDDVGIEPKHPNSQHARACAGRSRSYLHYLTTLAPLQQCTGRRHLFQPRLVIRGTPREKYTSLPACSVKRGLPCRQGEGCCLHMASILSLIQSLTCGIAGWIWIYGRLHHGTSMSVPRPQEFCKRIGFKTLVKCLSSTDCSV